MPKYTAWYAVMSRTSSAHVIDGYWLYLSYFLSDLAYGWLKPIITRNRRDNKVHHRSVS